jgi:hypothetical protein
MGEKMDEFLSPPKFICDNKNAEIKISSNFEDWALEKAGCKGTCHAQILMKEIKGRRHWVQKFPSNTVSR